MFSSGVIEIKKKDQFLEQTKQARQERAYERKRDQAAICLQVGPSFKQATRCDHSQGSDDSIITGSRQRFSSQTKASTRDHVSYCL